MNLPRVLLLLSPVTLGSLSHTGLGVPQAQREREEVTHTNTELLSLPGVELFLALLNFLGSSLKPSEII